MPRFSPRLVLFAFRFPPPSTVFSQLFILFCCFDLFAIRPLDRMNSPPHSRSCFLSPSSIPLFFPFKCPTPALTAISYSPFRSQDNPPLGLSFSSSVPISPALSEHLFITFVNTSFESSFLAPKKKDLPFFRPVVSLHSRYSSPPARYFSPPLSLPLYRPICCAFFPRPLDALGLSTASSL